MSDLCMNAETYRELLKAKAELDDVRENVPHEWDESDIDAIALRAIDRDLSRWELCPNPCVDGIIHASTPENGVCSWCQSGESCACPRCQGSGVIPNQEGLEAARLAADEAYEEGRGDGSVVIEAAIRAFGQTGEPT